MITAQWLNLSDYRPLVFPYALLMILFAIWVAPNLPDLARFMATKLPVVRGVLFFVIPAGLLLIAGMRKEQGRASR